MMGALASRGATRSATGLARLERPHHTELSRRFGVGANRTDILWSMLACDARCGNRLTFACVAMVSFACYHLWLRVQATQPTLVNPRSRSHRSLLESSSSDSDGPPYGSHVASSTLSRAFTMCRCRCGRARGVR